MASIIKQFLSELATGTGWEPDNAREVLAQLADRMTGEERAACLTHIAKLEAVGSRSQRLRRTVLDIVPPDSMLREYIEFVQVSEAPDTFHLFCLLSVMSHLVGRRVWFQLGTKPIFPMLSVFLVSPAGQARRSSAIKLALDLGREAGASVIQDQMTPEGLVATLQTRSSLLVVADEAATLLSKREYMGDMPAMLCTLLDAPDAYQRTLKGTFVSIPQPSVNALIGCAPEWILSAMPKTALGGGLLSRMLVVYEPARKCLIPLPEDLVSNELIDKMRGHLVIRLRQVTDVMWGRVGLDGEAKERFRLAYAEANEALGGASDKMAVYFSRKADHLLRLALLLHIAKEEQGAINVDTLERALLLLRLIESGMEVAYRQAGLEKPGQLQTRILSALDRGGGRLQRSELLKRVCDVMDAHQMNQVLETLKELGEVMEKKELVGNKLGVTYMRVQR